MSPNPKSPTKKEIDEAMKRWAWLMLREYKKQKQTRMLEVQKGVK